MEATEFLDAKGLACPMPIVRVKKKMDQLNTADVLEVHATDKGSVADLAAWAESTENKMIKTEQVDEVYKFWIEKG